jgi:hypothetical protein
MKTIGIFLLLGLTLSGCVAIQSNTKSDAVPPSFHRVLVVAKMRKAQANYMQQFARQFPAGYEVCTLLISPLSFDNPDEVIRKQVADCQSDVILMVELNRPGHASRYSSYPFEYNVEMQSAATRQPFWKAIISSNPSYGEEVPPRPIIKRLLEDHIIEGKLPSQTYSYQASN